MRKAFIAFGVAVGLAAGAASTAMAEGRVVIRTSSPATATNYSTPSRSAHAASNQDAGGKMERRCVIMSCGTPWCFNARVN